MPSTCTAFRGTDRIAAGDWKAVVREAKALLDAAPESAILMFDDATGQFLDIDLHGTPAQIEQQIAALTPAPVPEPAAPQTQRGPGRPKLGVVAREVTLLPRHWDWLADQPGGASVTLRRLVDQARSAGARTEAVRNSQNAAWRFLLALAGNQPGFEEVIRALFAANRTAFDELTRAWPPDVRSYAQLLAAPAFQGDI